MTDSGGLQRQYVFRRVLDNHPVSPAGEILAPHERWVDGGPRVDRTPEVLEDLHVILYSIDAVRVGLIKRPLRHMIGRTDEWSVWQINGCVIDNYFDFQRKAFSGEAVLTTTVYAPGPLVDGEPLADALVEYFGTRPTSIP